MLPTRTGVSEFVLVIACRTTAIEKVFQFVDLAASGTVLGEPDAVRRLLKLRRIKVIESKTKSLNLEPHASARQGPAFCPDLTFLDHPFLDNLRDSEG
jgi:hypothetical protein